MLATDAIYRIQVGLNMIKRCFSCGAMKPVAAFDEYGALSCTDCRSVSVQEDWWAAQKAKVGIA